MAFGGVIGAVGVNPAKTEKWLSRRPLRAIHRFANRPLFPPQQNLCPELDCVRDILPRHVIAAAERRARAIGIGADRVLICADAITEESYMRALASSLGTIYETLEDVSRADCPLDDTHLIQAAAAGLLPLREAGKIVWVVAPRRLTARRFADPKQQPQWLSSSRLTTSERLSRFVAQYTQRALGRQAAEGLQRARPLLSNAPRPRGRTHIIVPALALFALAGLLMLPAPTIDALGALLCAIFLTAAALRLWTALYSPRAPAKTARIPDDKLPIYTIICALHREANVVGDLVAALHALDYPIEKLQVIFALEAHDRDTRQAIERLDLGPSFEIVIAPDFGPRTKPKALNAALPFARGLYTVVYDAEDTPEPGQLRRAVATFMANDDQLACLQASLTIDNTADNWLACMFTANYAGQFDVFLPGLASLRVPFPLGGSSNHFRTTVLHRVGGWDPYNVTEDADLGIRLHRCGYRAATLRSSTYEEAPTRFVPWIKQRTRWFKGWMQTWRVHMRRPLQLVRDVGLGGAAAFQLCLACNVVAPLIHPIFMIRLCYALLMQPRETITGADPGAWIFIATFLAGYASTIALDLVGLQRRRLLAHRWVLVLTPLHWLLLSLAAWRALFQLLYDQQGWEKTEHGLAKHSRIAQSKQRTRSG